MSLPLPDLQQALLDEMTLDQLLRDIELATEVLEVTVKGGARERAADRPVSIGEARVMLQTGAVRGVQLRYRFDGAEWWDTLMATGEGVRLVRIRHVWEEVPGLGSPVDPPKDNFYV